MAAQIFEGLEPFLQKLNELIAQFEAAGTVVTPEIARTNLENLSRFLSQIPEIAYCSSSAIRLEGGQSIPVRVYSPEPETALPVFVYFHGGGHMAGSTALYDPICRKMALAAHAIVISVEYRLAPEYPFPLGLDDCYQAVLNRGQVLSELRWDQQLILGGDSAGGSITASLTARSALDPLLSFDKQVLIYPCVDYTMSFPSIERNGKGYLLERSRMSWYFDHYFQNGEDRYSASPLFAPLPERIPATLLVTAGFDPLCDEGYAYLEKLSEAGAQVRHTHFPDMIHAFMNIEDLVTAQCLALYKAIGDFVQSPA